MALEMAAAPGHSEHLTSSMQALEIPDHSTLGGGQSASALINEDRNGSRIRIVYDGTLSPSDSHQSNTFGAMFATAVELVEEKTITIILWAHTTIQHIAEGLHAAQHIADGLAEHYPWSYGTDSRGRQVRTCAIGAGMKPGPRVLLPHEREIIEGSGYTISIARFPGEQDWHVDVYSEGTEFTPSVLARFINDLQWMRIECDRVNATDRAVAS